MDPAVLQVIIDIIFSVAIMSLCCYIFLLSHSMAHWELPYVPTMRQGRKALKRYLKVKKNDRILDLGSGLGRMLVFFSQYPVEVTGIEQRKFLAFVSRVRLALRFWKKAKVQVIRGDFFEILLQDYTIIYAFHITKITKKLAPKIEKELGKDAMLISYKFPYPLSSKKFTEEKLEDAPGSFFYVYRRR